MKDVIRCACCGREQALAPEGAPGGITEDEAREIGWELWVHEKTGDEKWLCPFEEGPAN